MRDNNGQYPETIACVLWGTDNIKTYGESLAQIMWMVSVKPVPDALGRINKPDWCLPSTRRRKFPLAFPPLSKRKAQATRTASLTERSRSR